MAMAQYKSILAGPRDIDVHLSILRSSSHFTVHRPAPEVQQLERIQQRVWGYGFRGAAALGHIRRNLRSRIGRTSASGWRTK
jgi:hypothetical protein